MTFDLSVKPHIDLVVPLSEAEMLKWNVESCTSLADQIPTTPAS